MTAVEVRSLGRTGGGEAKTTREEADGRLRRRPEAAAGGLGIGGASSLF